MILKTLSFDPGEKNFAYAILHHKYINNELSHKVITNGIINNTIRNLNNRELFESESINFHNEIKSLISNDIHIISTERFMGRGIKVGNMIETVNIMIGILSSLSKDIHGIFPTFIHAASWKNAYNRNAKDLNHCYKICKTSNHQLDASLLGVYSSSIHYDVKPFTSVKNIRNRDKFFLSIEKTSQSSLIKRRIKRKYYNE